MCLFRDWGVCWVLSIGFELLELSMGWLVPQVRPMNGVSQFISRTDVHQLQQGNCYDIFSIFPSSRALSSVIDSPPLMLVPLKKIDYDRYRPCRCPVS